MASVTSMTPEMREAARQIRADLLSRATEQPKTRQGTRWGTELARAATTIEQVYELDDE